MTFRTVLITRDMMAVGGCGDVGRRCKITICFSDQQHSWRLVSQRVEDGRWGEGLSCRRLRDCAQEATYRRGRRLTGERGGTMARAALLIPKERLQEMRQWRIRESPRIEWERATRKTWREVKCRRVNED